MIAGKVAGENCRQNLLQGNVDLKNTTTNGELRLEMLLRTSVHIRRFMDGIMKSDTLMNAALKLISPDQMKIMAVWKTS